MSLRRGGILFNIRVIFRGKLEGISSEVEDLSLIFQTIELYLEGASTSSLDFLYDDFSLLCTTIYGPTVDLLAGVELCVVS